MQGVVGAMKTALVFVWSSHGIKLHLAISRDSGLDIFKGRGLLVFIRSMWISKWEGIKFGGVVFLPFETHYKTKPPEVDQAS